MVIFLEQGADLHMAQLIPLTVSCFSKIQIGFTFLVLAHRGSPGPRAIKRVYDDVEFVHQGQENVWWFCCRKSRRRRDTRSRLRRWWQWDSLTVLQTCKVRGSGSG